MTDKIIDQQEPVRTPEEMNASIAEVMSRVGLTLTEKQLKQYVTYYNLLVQVNQVMNLTAITEFDDVIIKHYLDSVCLTYAADYLNFTRNEDERTALPCRVLDMGSGAGLPGVPLKITWPQIHLVMADSLAKRVTFLQNIIAQCGLDHTEAVHARAEELGRDTNYRQQFDLCVSRAVADLSVLAEYTLPFVKVGGTAVYYKSAECREEVEQAGHAIALLGGHIEQIISYTLPGTDIGRALVIVQKEHETPKQYPRKPGTPAKKPLR